MAMTNQFALIPCNEILLDREDRQRTKIDTAGLKESIARNGVLQPIVVNRTPKGLELVFGERRLTASLELELPFIPVRFIEDLSVLELKVLEFEENAKRSALHWRDTVAALGEIHTLYSESQVEWSVSKSAQELSISNGWLGKVLRVFRDLDSPKIATSTDINSAYNTLAKGDQRKADGALAELLEGGTEVFLQASRKAHSVEFGLPDGASGGVEGDSLAGQPVAITETISQVQSPTGGIAQGALPTISGLPAPTTIGHSPTPSPVRPPPPAKPLFADSILHQSFLDWAPQYSGPKFNFLHCDFPYGVNAFDGSQGAQGTASSSDMGEGGMALAKAKLYDDSPDTYWELLACLCENRERLLTPTAHMMFWFSMTHYVKTLEFFRKHAPDLEVQPFPLVWHKTDNRGIIPDARREPRRVYETCLLASRGDRMITKVVSNTYGAPTNKEYHHSTKPEPVLRHFMTMLVDDTTRMLDPTCGSGSALRAAESLGARFVLGLEIDPEHHQSAKDALHKFRLMRAT